MVLLRDGRTLIGYLRSVDQFANLVLHRTIERIYVGQEFGDIPRGVFIVRGENVVLLGEIVCSYCFVITEGLVSLYWYLGCGKRSRVTAKRSFRWWNFRCTKKGTRAETTATQVTHESIERKRIASFAWS